MHASSITSENVAIPVHKEIKAIVCCDVGMWKTLETSSLILYSVSATHCCLILSKFSKSCIPRRAAVLSHRALSSVIFTLQREVEVHGVYYEDSYSAAL